MAALDVTVGELLAEIFRAAASARTPAVVLGGGFLGPGTSPSCALTICSARRARLAWSVAYEDAGDQECEDRDRSREGSVAVVGGRAFAGGRLTAGGAGGDGLAVAVAGEVVGQRAGGLVAAGAGPCRGAFMTIQSSSPRTRTPSLAGSVRRLVATSGRVRADWGESRGGLGGLDLADHAAHLVIRRRAERAPVERGGAGEQLVQEDAQGVDVGAGVDVERAVGLLGGHILRGSDELVKFGVKTVFSVSRAAVALAMPKSMTRAKGLPSWVLTRMLPGLRSRWMMPFWWACWTAWQTWVKRSRRSATLRTIAVAVLGNGVALDQLHDEVGAARFGGAGVEHAGDIRVVHHGQGLALGLEAGDDGAGVHTELNDLEGDSSGDRVVAAQP